MEWPFTTKTRMRSETLTAVQALEQRLDQEHRQRILALDEQHAENEKQIVRGAVVGAYNAILQERDRCAGVASRISTSGRPAVMRQRILDDIRNASMPVLRHPLLPDAENPTVPKDPQNRLATMTAPTNSSTASSASVPT